jgi:hypothetical protein
MIRKALEISQRQEEERKRLVDEEDDMMRRAIEMSEIEERERVKKLEAEDSLIKIQQQMAVRKSEIDE